MCPLYTLLGARPWDAGLPPPKLAIQTVVAFGRARSQLDLLAAPRNVKALQIQERITHGWRAPASDFAGELRADIASKAGGAACVLLRVSFSLCEAERGSPAFMLCTPPSLRQRIGLRTASVAKSNGAYARVPDHPPWTRLLNADRGQHWAGSRNSRSRSGSAIAVVRSLSEIASTGKTISPNLSFGVRSTH